jgi:tocopherol O-methyltransferase
VDELSAKVASHYNDLDPYYRRFWGEHLHHGLWEKGSVKSADEAVKDLVKHVAHVSGIEAGAKVCDVGCGYGASARMLANQYGAEVTGLTLSSVQAEYAAHNLAPSQGSVTVLQRNWLENKLPAAAFDVVMAIESSEHVANKPAFFREAFRVLKPGGRLVLCAWLANPTARGWERRYLLKPIVREGRLATLNTRLEYKAYILRSGLTEVRHEDLSRKVKKTWPLALKRFAIGLAGDVDLRRFLLSNPNRDFAKCAFRIWAAFETGAFRYGLFSARKPA